MDRPFREVHELYRILFLRAQEQQRQAEEQRKKEEEEAKRNSQSKGQSTRPPDVNQTSPSLPTNMDMEDIQDALEEMM